MHDRRPLQVRRNDDTEEVQVQGGAEVERGNAQGNKG